MENKVYEAVITSKGQMVIPKKFRDTYNLKRGTRVKIIAGKDSIIIKPRQEGPYTGLRGMLKGKLANMKTIDRLIEEAEKSLFKVALS